MDTSLGINRLIAVALWSTALNSACYARRVQTEDIAPLIVAEARATPFEAGRVRAEELGAAGVVSLQTALNRVRPEFLRRNVIPGTQGDLALPSIYMNGRYVGALDVLDLVQVIEVAEVRYFRPATAQMIYGAACACNGGVIDVTTRRLP